MPVERLMWGNCISDLENMNVPCNQYALLTWDWRHDETECVEFEILYSTEMRCAEGRVIMNSDAEQHDVGFPSSATYLCADHAMIPETRTFSGSKAVFSAWILNYRAKRARCVRLSHYHQPPNG
jgi:hypothetical protein